MMRERVQADLDRPPDPLKERDMKVILSAVVALAFVAAYAVPAAAQ